MKMKIPLPVTITGRAAKRTETGEPGTVKETTAVMKVRGKKQAGKVTGIMWVTETEANPITLK
jgi:hypothetical protein